MHTNNWNVHNYILYLVPTPGTVNVTVVRPQTVGQQLTLECDVTTVRGITSRVDIVWSSDGSELERTEGVNNSIGTNYSMLYTEFYVIPQLSTLDEGRTITCHAFINAMPPVTATDSVTLNVTGKCNISNLW